MRGRLDRLIYLLQGMTILGDSSKDAERSRDSGVTMTWHRLGRVTEGSLEAQEQHGEISVDSVHGGQIKVKSAELQLEIPDGSTEIPGVVEVLAKDGASCDGGSPHVEAIAGSGNGQVPMVDDGSIASRVGKRQVKTPARYCGSVSSGFALHAQRISVKDRMAVAARSLDANSSWRWVVVDNTQAKGTHEKENLAGRSVAKLGEFPSLFSLERR
jgi:hypothetical protein